MSAPQKFGSLLVGTAADGARVMHDSGRAVHYEDDAQQQQQQRVYLEGGATTVMDDEQLLGDIWAARDGRSTAATASARGPDGSSVVIPGIARSFKPRTADGLDGLAPPGAPTVSPATLTDVASSVRQRQAAALAARADPDYAFVRTVAAKANIALASLVDNEYVPPARPGPPFVTSATWQPQLAAMDPQYAAGAQARMAAGWAAADAAATAAWVGAPEVSGLALVSEGVYGSAQDAVDRLAGRWPGLAAATVDAYVRSPDPSIVQHFANVTARLLVLSRYPNNPGYHLEKDPARAAASLRSEITWFLRARTQVVGGARVVVSENYAARSQAAGGHSAYAYSLTRRAPPGLGILSAEWAPV